MKKLPEAEVYEQESTYWPYKKSLKKVLDIISRQAPKKGSLLDMMCGPGYLLGQIAEKRKDLSLLGVDIDKRYVRFSKEKYPKIKFEIGDVLKWKPKNLFDVVICTGSLHHISYEKQEEAVGRMAAMVKLGGFCIISDCYVDDYSNEKQRKLSAAKLGYEYLRETINNGAPDEVVKATIDILYNDVLRHEYKMSLKKRQPIFGKYFRTIGSFKTWPKMKSGYGDYVHVLKLR